MDRAKTCRDDTADCRNGVSKVKHWKLILSTILLIPAIYIAIIWIVPIIMFFSLYGFKEAWLTLDGIPTRAFIWLILAVGYIVSWTIEMCRRKE